MKRRESIVDCDWVRTSEFYTIMWAMYDLGIEAKSFDRTQASNYLRAELCIPGQKCHPYRVPMTRGRNK